MTETLTIDGRYHGFDGVGHGGYVGGFVSRGMIAAEVTFRAPPPLDRALRREMRGDESFAFMDGETVVVEVRPARFENELDLELPPAPAWAAAKDAAGRCPTHGDHPCPSCFACGPERAEGEGLKLTPGPLADGRLMAAPWVPHTGLAAADGTVGTEFVWAALDCPGWFALCGETLKLMVTGRMTVRIFRPVAAGARHVIASWPIARKGRKQFSGSALFTEAGEVCAAAHATWFEPAKEA